jgi:hypothetical protein
VKWRGSNNHRSHVNVGACPSWYGHSRTERWVVVVVVGGKSCVGMDESVVGEPDYRPLLRAM